MAYAWIAFYEQNWFVKEVPGGRPPPELADLDGRRHRLTSLQLYDHAGRAFIAQDFDAGRRPVAAVIAVPSAERAGTVPCHILGWQEEARDAVGDPCTVQHLAHVVEDGRVIMAAGPVEESVFRRPRRRLHPGTRPFTWAAIYDHVDAPPSRYQFDPITGIETSGEHIDRGRLRALVLADGSGDPWIEQIYAPGQRVIYRRRVAMLVDRPDPVVVFLLGWRRAVHAAGLPADVQHVAYTFQEGGATVMAGAFDEVHPFFHGIEPVPADHAVVGVGGPCRRDGVGRE